MSIFIGNLIGFAVIVFIIVRWVVPPVKELMRKRQESVRTALKESAEAAKKLADADARHAKAIEDAEKISQRVAEEARHDAESIAEQLAEQADVEVHRIKNQGAQQIQLLRAQAIRALRCKLGEETVAKADELVRSHVSDDAARSATVDHFLDQLDDMAPTSFKFETSAHARLRATSRAAIDAVTAEFDDVVGRLGAPGLTELAADLAAVAQLLLAEPVLRRHLAESSDEPEAKARLVDTLLSGKVGDHTLKLLQTAAAQRWSDEMDLVEGIEHAARLALLKRADVNDEVDAVEEQLFRLGRTLDAQPRLNSLLTDYTRPADGRVELLNKVLDEGAVNETAKLLLGQTIGLLRGEHADEAVVDLAELAVSRRGEIVAHVTAAAELSDEQRSRLAEVLGRIYEHPVSVQLNVDPELLGGLSVTVGDEVIDGSIAARLGAALTQLPD